MSFTDFFSRRSLGAWFFRMRDLWVALLFATILVFPLTGFSLWPQGFDQMYFSVASDEEHYASSVREVSEGRWFHRNTYLFEEKHGTPNVYMWGEVVFGLLFRLWPFGIAWFVLFSKWVGVAASFFLLVKLFRKLLPETAFSFWAYAAAGGFFILPAFLGSSFFLRVFDALRFQGVWIEGLGTLRFINPIITYILLLGWMYFFLKFFERPRFFLAVMLGAWLGVIVWFYIYFWMVASTILGLSALWFLWKREKRSLALSCLALVASSLLVIPYILSVRWQMSQSALTLVQPLPSLKPLLISYAVMAVYAGFFALRAWRVYRRQSIWGFFDKVMGVFILGSLLAENQHFVTRVTIQPHHFYFLVDLPLAGWVTVLLLREATLAFASRIEQKVALGVFIGIVWLGLGVQIATVRNVRVEFVDRQRLVSAFDWIKERGYPLVVYADNRASELIPMYTQADVYYALHATFYESTSQDRRELAWFVSKRLSGLTDLEDVPAAFERDREEIGYRVFESQYWRDRCGSYGCFPDSYLQDLISKYKVFLSQDFSRVWKTYRFDVVLWDEELEPSWALERYPFLQKIWMGDGVSIWRWNEGFVLDDRR